MVKHNYNYAYTCGTDCHDKAATDINNGQVMGRLNDRMIFFTINIIPIIFLHHHPQPGMLRVYVSGES
jgi:hypothetical protein